jgi:hypothetical protein
MPKYIERESKKTKEGSKRRNSGKKEKEAKKREKQSQTSKNFAKTSSLRYKRFSLIRKTSIKASVVLKLIGEAAVEVEVDLGLVKGDGLLLLFPPLFKEIVSNSFVRLAVSRRDCWKLFGSPSNEIEKERKGETRKKRKKRKIKTATKEERNNVKKEKTQSSKTNRPGSSKESMSSSIL